LRCQSWFLHRKDGLEEFAKAQDRLSPSLGDAESAIDGQVNEPVLPKHLQVLRRARWCQVEKVSNFSGTSGRRPARLHDEASVWVRQRSQKAIELLLCFGHRRNVFRFYPKHKDLVWRTAWPNGRAPAR